MKPISI